MNKWDLISFVTASDYRQTIILALQDGEKQPTELTTQTGRNFSHISRTLTELADRELVDRRQLDDGRKWAYRLTPTGREIAANVTEVVAT